MKRFAIMLLASGLGAASLPSYAMEMGQATRLGASVGRYEGVGRVRGFDPSGTPVTDEITNRTVRLTYGGELGYTITMADFYADLGLYALRVKFQDEQNWRTDLLATFGYYINDSWTVFAGFRRGWQGPHIFNDDTFKELGPYVGFGYGGIPLGGGWNMNTTAAYNFDKVKNFPGAPAGFHTEPSDFNYPGISLKLSVNKKGTPHSLQLRLQRFSKGASDQIIDDSTGSSIGRVDFNLTETWALLSYVFTLGW